MRVDSNTLGEEKKKKKGCNFFLLEKKKSGLFFHLQTFL